MSYFAKIKRVCTGTVEKKLVDELLELPYATLIRERRYITSLLKEFDGAKRLELIPTGIAKEDLALMVCAYKKAVRSKEKEVLRKAFLRGRT